ncbi:NmrA family NAD(P)-binding protein [Roseobacter sp. YSTF-M11]|uniref:NmrA family NAD(P)-binding protein n=1 Tax=Roseobacter insulae TaxID=2859783 RepID=A0A9X1FS40_9RHOB|nr:NmrA family NAD(P)-binding protein [Roseobacter insulae]MBW4706597.1 NmrA family NAD(P)-binding protein [Roseobacter insulae]
MSTTPKILVTSAAGKTGFQVALQLREKDVPVRAFVRRQDARADRLAAAGAEVFIGNQYALTDLRRAMNGVQRAYQCAPTAPNGLHFNATFSAAAYEARLEHVVSLGQWLSSVDHPSLFTREVYISDILIGMRAEMSVTIVNPGWFADNYLMGIDMAAHLGLLAMPLGDGTVKKNAPPSNEDIARVAVAALMDPAAHAGRTYRPTGPVLMSPNEIASAMGRALGRKVTYRDISDRMMLKALRAVPPSNYSEAAVSQLAIYAEEYRRGAFAVNAPTEAVATIGGQAPELFEAIVRRTVAARPDLARSGLRSLTALGVFAKMLVTRPPDLERMAADRDFVQLKTPRLCQDDPSWRKSHSPDPENTPREAA